MAILKAQFYVLRLNGCGVPLVALDELPQNIQIEGVPRILTLEDASTMMCVPGKHESRHQTHKVVNNNKVLAASASQVSALGATHDDLWNNSATFTECDVEQQRPRIFTQEEMRNREDDASIRKQKHRKFNPGSACEDADGVRMRLPPLGKKIYCSHWISTGECDYAQQGCLYKHVMPLDLTLLNHLGFQDVPKWYRDKYGIGKLTAVPGSGAHTRGHSKQSALMQSNWRLKVQRDTRPMNSACSSTLTPKRHFTKSVSPHPSKQTFENSLIDLEFESRPPSTEHVYQPFKNESNHLVAGDDESAWKPHRIHPSFEHDTGLSKPRRKSQIEKSNDASSEPFSKQFTVEDYGRYADVTALPRPKRKPSPGQMDVSASAKHSNDSAERHELGRKCSTATDYEGELVHQTLQHDIRQGEEYANTKARFARQQEEFDMNRPQEGTSVESEG